MKESQPTPNRTDGYTENYRTRVELAHDIVASWTDEFGPEAISLIQEKLKPIREDLTDEVIKTKFNGYRGDLSKIAISSLFLGSDDNEIYQENNFHTIDDLLYYDLQDLRKRGFTEDQITELNKKLKVAVGITLPDKK